MLHSLPPPKKAKTYIYVELLFIIFHINLHNLVIQDETTNNCENLSFTEKFVLISRSLKHTAHFLYERLTNRFKSTYYHVNKKQQKRSRGESKKRKNLQVPFFHVYHAEKTLFKERAP